MICGHVHTPQCRTTGLAYFNTGDWVEHRTALVEWNDGSLELSPAELVERNVPTAASGATKTGSSGAKCC